MVVGAGFAGEGHVRALRDAGVEVAALCGREMPVVAARAAALGVADARVDWRQALDAHRPDIVALATPAALRRDVIAEAASRGCHLLCEKPLATYGEEAAALWRIVDQAGVRHAFAATRWYEPSVAWLAELVADGRIGAVQEAVLTIRACLAPPLPWSWALSLEQGGGLLNNHFPHVLAILERVLGGPAVHAGGQARFAIDRAPVVPGIHDFRDWATALDGIDPARRDLLEWRAVDADTSYAALLRIATPSGEVPTTVLSGPGVAPGAGVGMRLVGDRGILSAWGETAYTVAWAADDDAEPVPLPVPARLALPDRGGGCEDRWAALARDFVADLRGAAHAPYPTFRQGRRTQEAIDAIRDGRGGAALTP